jgi:hypothetical protein
MKNFTQLLIAFLTFTSLATASDGMKVEVQAYLKETDEGRELWISTLLINQTDEEKTVLIEPPETTLLRDAEGLVLQVGFTGRSRVSGYEILPSISEYKPVSLRKNEATRIMTNVKNNRTLESIEPGEDIRIRYVVRDVWSERFNLWDETNETTTQIKTM